METELRQILREILELEDIEVQPTLKRTEVDSWDSLRHLRLVTAVEEEFGIRFSMEEIRSIEGITELQNLVSAKAAKPLP